MGDIKMHHAFVRFFAEFSLSGAEGLRITAII